MEQKDKVPWTKLIWARPNIPRHAFISWVIQHRLPTKERLSTHHSRIPSVHCVIQRKKMKHTFSTLADMLRRFGKSLKDGGSIYQRCKMVSSY